MSIWYVAGTWNPHGCAHEPALWLEWDKAGVGWDNACCLLALCQHLPAYFKSALKKGRRLVSAVDFPYPDYLIKYQVICHAPKCGEAMNSPIIFSFCIYFFFSRERKTSVQFNSCNPRNSSRVWTQRKRKNVLLHITEIILIQTQYVSLSPDRKGKQLFHSLENNFSFIRETVPAKCSILLPRLSD